MEEADGEQRFTFDGAVIFAFTALDDADNITLHIKDITIKDNTIMVHEGVGHGGKMVPHGKWKHDEDREFFVLPLNSKLETGEELLDGWTDGRIDRQTKTGRQDRQTNKDRQTDRQS